MSTSRPKTGDKRRVNQPLKIDRLPVEVREAIKYLKNIGKTWQEIEELSSLPFNKKWLTAGGGFVNWEDLPTSVLELFPEMRLPHTNLHRWFDLRVEQITAEVMARSAQAREIATSFAKSIVKGADNAVVNAARDQLMSILAEDATPKARAAAAKALIALAEVMQGARANDIKERRVGVDERRIHILEERDRLASERVDQATKNVARKGTGQFSLEEINKLREQTFGLPPLVIENA